MTQKNKILLRYLSQFLIVLFFSLIIAFRPVGSDLDSLKYYQIFENNGIDPTFNTKLEPLFDITMTVIRDYFGLNFNFFLLFIAILSIGLKTYSINKIFHFPYLALLVYFGFFLIIHEVIQIRIGIALAFVLWSIPNILKRELKYFLIKIIIAFLFHYSTILFIILYKFNLKNYNKYLYILLPLFGFLISNFIQELLLMVPMSQDYLILYKIFLYMQNQENLNEKFHLLVFGLFNYLTYCVFIFIVFFVKNKDKLLILGLKVYSLSLFFGLLLSFNAEFSNRIFMSLSFFGTLVIYVYMCKIFKYNHLVIVLLLLLCIRQFIVFFFNNINL
jgi:hypothetical protein